MSFAEPESKFGCQLWFSFCYKNRQFWMVKIQSIDRNYIFRTSFDKCIFTNVSFLLI